MLWSRFARNYVSIKSVVKLSVLWVHFDLREFDLLDLKIKVAQPIINIRFVLVLNSAEFVDVNINTTKKERDFETPLI